MSDSTPTSAMPSNVPERMEARFDSLTNLLTPFMDAVSGTLSKVESYGNDAKTRFDALEAKVDALFGLVHQGFSIPVSPYAVVTPAAPVEVTPPAEPVEPAAHAPLAVDGQNTNEQEAGS